MQKEHGESDSFQNERREIADLFLTAAQPAVRAGRMHPDVTHQTFMVMQQAMAAAITGGNSSRDRTERAWLFRSLIFDGLMLPDRMDRA